MLKKSPEALEAPGVRSTLPTPSGPTRLGQRSIHRGRDGPRRPLQKFSSQRAGDDCRQPIDDWRVPPRQAGQYDHTVAEDEGQADEQQQAPAQSVALNPTQKSIVDTVSAAVDRSLEIKKETDPDREYDLREVARQGKAYILIGPPGAEKTTTAMECIEHAVKSGGRVLVAMPAAQLASRMRELLGKKKGIDIDTCAAAFALLENDTACLPTLGMFDLVCVDEVFHVDSGCFE